MRNHLQRNLHLVFASLSALVFSICAYHFGTAWPAYQNIAIGAGLGLLAYGLFYLIFYLFSALFGRMSLQFRLTILSIVAVLVAAQWAGFGWPPSIYYPAALLMVALLLLLAWGASIKGSWWGKLAVMILPLVLIAGGVVWLLREGQDPFPRAAHQEPSVAALMSLSAEGLTNPSEAGSYEYTQFTYGSGTDQRRPEYAAGVRFATPTVDATRLLPQWEGKKKKWRERYWGFGVEAFPLNGRVYLPEGQGPFPLVLIVHGNHSMIDYSDGGYAYLGELLASRGMIAVSVDENFINGHWSGDFRGKEMPTRAWLLLKHLEQWRSWTSDVGHDLYGKVDTAQIMLVGHSRGGEAVSIAAAYNKLPFFPDDAQEVFDFNFGIKGIVTIAPTDYRYHRQIQLENINYLSLQGSYDADETSFWGLRPYHRLAFTDSIDYFKAGVYIHRANHGQFNSSWGRHDFGGMFAHLMNTQPMMSAEEQQQAAKVFITGFAEVVFNGQRAYQSLFLSPEAAAAEWLPPGDYLGRFASSRNQSLQTFEEDIDLTTASHNIRLRAAQFEVWREENLSARDGGSQENNAVLLGWNYGEEMEADSIASYSLILPDSLSFAVDSFQHLIMDIGVGDWSELEGFGNYDGDSIHLDFRIQLVNQNGQMGQAMLSQSGKLPTPPLRTRFTKFAHLDQEMFEQEREIQLETFVLPMFIFQTESGEIFNWRDLQQIRLVFDQSPAGILVIDNIRLGWD